MTPSSRRRFYSVAAPFVCSLVAACAARANVNVNSDAEASVNSTPKPLATDWSDAPGDPAAAGAGVQPLGDARSAQPGRSLVGVRHDLGLAANAPRTPSCSCLAARVGSPSDAGFAWQAGAPEQTGDALAIAISTRGVGACAGADANEDNRRASISAVLREGKDVVIEIEEVPASRPLATGALFDPPEPGGSVYVRARSAKVPYGRGTNGGACKLK